MKILNQIKEILDSAKVNYEVESDGNQLKIVVKDNSVKEEFESLIKDLDDDIFESARDHISEIFPSIGKAYMENPLEVIKEFLMDVEDSLNERIESDNGMLDKIEGFKNKNY